MLKVTVIIVTYNSAHHLPETLRSLRNQTFQDFTLQVVDNASADGSGAVAREWFPQGNIFTNVRNLGFCRAANQGVKLARSRYVMLLNADVALTASCLERLVSFAEDHPEAVSFGPKLLRLGDGDPSCAHHQPTAAVIDAAGLRMGRNRVAQNRGEGEADVGQYDQPALVFGNSGACVLYRRAALEAVAVGGEYLDVDFFAYKDDVDLAWRLQLIGLAAWCVPTAVAWHRRSVRRAGRGVVTWWRNRGRIPRRLRALSFKNQYLMVVKNEQRENFWRDLLPMAWQPLAVLALALTVEPFHWRSLPVLARQLPRAWAKRRVIQAKARVSPAEMRKWFRTNN